jgi:hypothetical protein
MRTAPRLGGVSCAALALALVGGGCDQDGASPTPTGTSGTTSSVQTRQPLPPPIHSRPASDALPTRLKHVWELPGDPDWLVHVGGLTWVKRDDGTVSALDPDRGVVKSIPSGYSSLPTCQGLSFDGDRLWTCAGENKMVMLDPRAGTAAPPIRVPRLSDQTRFPIVDGQIWLISATARSLVGVGINDGVPRTRIPLGAFCIDLARDETHSSTRVYAICPTDGQVLAVDVQTGAVESRLRLPDARAAELGASGLWVVFAGGVAQIAVPDLSAEAVYALPADPESEICATDDAVWVRMSGQQMLAKIIPATQTVEEVVTTSQYLTGGDLIVVGDDIWTSASDDSVVLHLSTG